MAWRVRTQLQTVENLPTSSNIHHTRWLFASLLASTLTVYGHSCFTCVSGSDRQKACKWTH